MPPLSKPTAVVRLTRVLRRPEACAPNRSLREAVWSSHCMPTRTKARFTGNRTTFPDCQTVANQAILSS